MLQGFNDSVLQLMKEKILDFDVIVDGMMGMAFDSSFIFAETSAAWGQESASVLGRSFITNLFAENSSLPNNFDVQLGRSDAVEDGCGTFVISGHSPSFVNVTHAPKIPRIGTDRWAFAVDEMRVNGKTVSFNKSSAVAGAPAGKLVAMLDTGYSFPPIPPAAVDAIYRTIPGSIFSAPDNEYFVPCNSTTMVSFFLGYVVCSIHFLISLTSDMTFIAVKSFLSILWISPTRSRTRYLSRMGHRQTLLSARARTNLSTSTPYLSLVSIWPSAMLSCGTSTYRMSYCCGPIVAFELMSYAVSITVTSILGLMLRALLLSR